MRAKPGDEVLLLERFILALGVLFLRSGDEDRPNKLLLSNLSNPLDDNFLLCSKDEDRPELLLLSNLSEPLDDNILMCSEDEDRLMSAKHHVWLAKPLFDLDVFLPFPCSDEERIVSAKRGAEELFLTESNMLLLSLDDNFLRLCSEDEDRPELLPLSNFSKPLDDNLLLCSEDEDRLLSTKLHVWLAKPVFAFDGFLPFLYSDEEERLMSAKRGAEELFLTESLFAVDDFRLVSSSSDEDGPRSTYPSFLIRSLLPLIAFLLPPCSDDEDKQTSGMSTFVLEDFLLLSSSEDEERPATTRFHALLAKSLSVFDDFRAFP
jgi:hypothetical protein